MKEQRNNTIIVTCDFSDIFNHALQHAINAAKIMKFKIILLHVIDKNSKAFMKKNKQDEQALEEKITKMCNDVKENHQVECSFILKEGSIFTTINQVVEEVKADFVLMGTHGKQGMQVFTGSNALKVILGCDAPFIVVQDKPIKEEYKDIVIPIDSSIESRQKVNWAVYFAKEFNSTVHVYMSNESDEFLSAKVMNNVRQIEGLLQVSNVEYVVVKSQDKGSFSKNILNYCNSIYADLVIIITNKDAMMPGVLVDSIEEVVIFNQFKIPVMCINPTLYMNSSIGVHGM